MKKIILMGLLTMNLSTQAYAKEIISNVSSLPPYDRITESLVVPTISQVSENYPTHILTTYETPGDSEYEGTTEAALSTYSDVTAITNDPIDSNSTCSTQIKVDGMSSASEAAISLVIVATIFMGIIISYKSYHLFREKTPEPGESMFYTCEEQPMDDSPMGAIMNDMSGIYIERVDSPSLQTNRKMTSC